MKMDTTEALKCSIRTLLRDELRRHVPIGISSRHLHVTAADYQSLFPGKEMRASKWLKQPGEFATEDMVSISGPRGSIENVRVLGPTREATQLELSKTDARTLGVDAPLRTSGNLDGAAEITITSAHGQIRRNAAIIARRHVHMGKTEADFLELNPGEVICAKVEGTQRTTVFKDVEVRVAEGLTLEMHLDTDEANAANVMPHTQAILMY